MSDLGEINLSLSAKSPREIVKYALGQHTRIALSFSGAEDVVLVDMLCKLTNRPEIFTLDTGRLHPETYRFIEQVNEHYRIRICVLSPDQQAVEALVREKGLYSFYRDGHQECCGIRKIEPLKRALHGLEAWITGQRKDQNPATRSSLPCIEYDPQQEYRGTPLLKYNPLANWSSLEVWNYIKMMEIPYNSLHQQGYQSIGCEPCTKAILPHQHEREGRWWWENKTQKECGLHNGSRGAKGLLKSGS